MSDSTALLQQTLPALLPRLRRFALCLVRKPAQADDLALLAIERLLARAHQWRPPPEGATAAQLESAMRSWMFSITKDVWMEELRAARRQRGLFAAATQTSQAADPSRPAPEQHPSLQAAMARLPAEQQLAIALVLVEGLSYAEAAQVLGVPVKRLTSQLSRGREALAGMPDEPGDLR